MKKITKAEIIADIEAGLVDSLFTLIHNGKWIIAGRSVKGMADDPRMFEIVYAEVGTA